MAALDGSIVNITLPSLSANFKVPLSQVEWGCTANQRVMQVDGAGYMSMRAAQLAGQLADGVILVVRAGHTTREAAMAAHQRFSEDHVRVFGTILNDWDPRKSPNGYYGYYSGSYGKYYSYSANEG